MQQYDAYFEQAGQRYNIDPALLRAVALVESGGNQNATSPVGAQGLTQIMPDTAHSLGVQDPYDPQQAIHGTAKLLDENLRRYGSVDKAILAYHGGTDQANWGPKTQQYLQKVSAAYGGSMPKQAAQQDAFARDFGDLAGGGNAAAAPVDAFERDFGASLTTPVGGQQPVSAPSQPEAPAASREFTASEALQQAWKSGPGAMLGTLRDVAKGELRGVSDVLDAPSEWLAAGAEKSGLSGLLARAGINMPTAEQQRQINKADRAEYEASNPGVAGKVGRVGGNIAATLVPLLGAESAVASGGSRLVNALSGSPRAAEALSAVGRFAGGKGGLLSRMAYGAEQGAAGSLLLSGGSDAPIGQQMGSGAAIGAAIPLAGAAITKTVGAGNNLLGALTKPFSEQGRAQIATDLVRKEAQAAGGVPATAAPYTPPLAAPTPFTPGPSIPPGVPPAATAEAAASGVDDLLGAAASGGRLPANFNEIIPGSRPTLAQATGNAGIAALERAAIGRSTAANNAFNELQQANNAARMTFFGSLKGSADDLAAAVARREQQAIPMLKQALDGAGEANPQPVVEAIDGILKSPEGQRDAVVSAMNAVKKKLASGEGLQSNVEQLYGIRKSINDQLENVAGRDNSASQLASRQLIEVRDALDEAIEGAAPGFRDYLKQYAELSKPIGAMNYLQKLDITDQTSSRITLAKVKSAIQRITREQQKPGANDAKAITQGQLSGLYRLQEDLQREANSALGKGIGSNTFQNLATNNLIDSMLGGTGSKAVTTGPAAVGGALGYLLGGPGGSAMGGLIGQHVGAGAGRAISSQSPAVEAQLIQLLTNPKGAEILQALQKRSVNPLTEDLLLRSRASGAAGGFFSGGSAPRK